MGVYKVLFILSGVFIFFYELYTFRGLYYARNNISLGVYMYYYTFYTWGSTFYSKLNIKLYIDKVYITLKCKKEKFLCLKMKDCPF